MKHDWTVPEDVRKERLDVFLSRMLPEMTRSRIAKLLKQGAGTVNGKPAAVHEFLNAGDRVTFDEARAAERRAPAEPAPPLAVIEETPAWIVIDKPAGLLVHPDGKQTEGTLVDAILAFDPTIASVGEDPSRPGIMHRLDKEASGLMVIARTQDAYDGLKKQFAGHAVRKRYLALVHGVVKEDEGELRFRIARSKTRQRMAARPEHETEGKAAWTHFKTLKRFKNASLLELDIFSGRTHQIRAHLLAFNHPIVGDPLYKRRSEEGKIPSPRLLLQSVHLSFADPTTGEQRSFDLPPAKTFADVIKTLS